MLSQQHRNNGYEDLTLHLTQSQSELRGRCGGGEGRRQVIRNLVRGRRVRTEGMQGEGEGARTWGREVVQAAERRVEDLTGVGNQVVQVRNVPINLDDEDDISELELDGGVPVGIRHGVELERIVVERERVDVGVEERAKALEDAWRWRGRSRRGRDYCTPEERKIVEEWIAACERARCPGFVKCVRASPDGSERVEDASQAEGEVHVRGGERAGWPEWGLAWGSASFMN